MIDVEIETEFTEEGYRFGDQKRWIPEVQAGWLTHKVNEPNVVFLRKSVAVDSDFGQFSVSGARPIANSESRMPCKDYRINVRICMAHELYSLS